MESENASGNILKMLTAIEEQGRKAGAKEVILKGYEVVNDNLKKKIAKFEGKDLKGWNITKDGDNVILKKSIE